MKLKFFPAAALALLCAFTLSAQAGDHDDGPPPDHPKYEEFCKDNPTTCEVGKERREAQKKWCEQNADKCQKLKDEREARHKKMKEQCEANPAECEKRKAEFRERIKERREKRQEKKE